MRSNVAATEFDQARPGQTRFNAAAAAGRAAGALDQAGYTAFDRIPHLTRAVSPGRRRAGRRRRPLRANSHAFDQSGGRI